MTEKHQGWVIVNIGHPTTGEQFFVNSTFAFRRKDAIANFVEGSGNSWRYWKDKYNFRAVKAIQTISVAAHQIAHGDKSSQGSTFPK